MNTNHISIEPPSQPYPWTFRRVMWATLVLACVALSFWLLFHSSQVLLIFFIAILIGTVVRPSVTWMYSRGVPRMVGGITISLFLIILLISFMLLLFPMIAEQGEKVASLVPAYYLDLREWMLNNPDPMISQLGQFLPVYLSIPMLAQQTGEQVLDSTGQEFDYVTYFVKIIFNIIAIPLLAFYWMLHGPRTVQSVLLLIPTTQRERIRDLVSAIEARVGAYVVGQSILCLVVGIMALIAYVIIGLPNALVLALIAGLLEAVPLIGPFLGAIPAAVIAITIGPSKLIGVIIATIVIQQLENTLLVPRIMRKTVGVNPFVTLLSLFAFSSLLGIPGAFMAIPIAAILQLLLDYFVFEPGIMGPEVSNGRDYASRLRYEAQDLAQKLRKQARLKKGGSDRKVKQIDQVMDEIEAISTDLDAMLAKLQSTGES